MISNPNYQGKWEPRKIANPDFFEDKNPFSSLTTFASIGLELWSMTDNIYFDNFIITDDEAVAIEFAKDSWEIKKKLELIGARSSVSAFILKLANILISSIFNVLFYLKDSVVDSLLNAATEKPWMWAVYVLVVLLPIVIIVVFCCGGKSEVKKTSDNKKTDAPTPDDPIPNEIVEEEEEEQDEEGEAPELVSEEKGSPNKKEDKSDLEPKLDDDDEEAPKEEVTFK